MGNSAGSSFHVTYDFFCVGDEWSKYKLTSTGQYGGNAGKFRKGGKKTEIVHPHDPKYL